MKPLLSNTNPRDRGWLVDSHLDCEHSFSKAISLQWWPENGLAVRHCHPARRGNHTFPTFSRQHSSWLEIIAIKKHQRRFMKFVTNSPLQACLGGGHCKVLFPRCNWPLSAWSSNWISPPIKARGRSLSAYHPLGKSETEKAKDMNMIIDQTWNAVSHSSCRIVTARDI